MKEQKLNGLNMIKVETLNKRYVRTLMIHAYGNLEFKALKKRNKPSIK